MNKNKILSLLLLSLLLCHRGMIYLYAEDSVTPLPYSQDEFPQWTKDLRRGEIITLGSLPFSTLLVSIAYGTYLYTTGQVTSFPSPFGYSGYTEDQQLKIFGISCAVSAGVGLTDWTVNFIKRCNAASMVKRQKELNRVTVLPVIVDENTEDTEDAE